MAAATSHEDGTFEQAFAPLAHHLFPDGCLDSIEGPDLSSTWPSRTDRRAISAKEALTAISQLQRVASRHGLTQSQLWAVCLAACETLPKTEASAAGSALVDGTSKCFRDLVRCMLPRHDNGGGIPSAVVMRLVSSRCDSIGRVAILRFLTLAIRSGALAGKARQTLSNLYGAIFPLVADPRTCMDAVRLLHAMTRHKHVRADRAQKLCDWYKGGSDSKMSSIWLLLQLFARYDPAGCGGFIPSSRATVGTSAWSRCFQIPDNKWERDFVGERASERDMVEHPRPKKRARVATAESGEQDSSLTFTVDWLNDAFDGVHSFSHGLVGNQARKSLRASDLLMDSSLQNLILLSVKGSSHSPANVADMEVNRLRACLPYMLHEEWYEQDSAKVASVNNYDDDDDDEKTNDATFTINNTEADDNGLEMDERTKQESSRHNEIRENDSQRLSLLKAMASAAARCNGLFPETESFLLEEILSHWDGSDRMGTCICNDLLPMLTPCSFPQMQSKVLRYLEPLLSYGSPRVQYAVISGALNGLLQRWGRLDWHEYVRKTANSRESVQEVDANVLKVRSLRELIKWADNIFLKSFLCNNGHELLGLSVVEFFETVASLSISCPFLVSPSPAVVYRVLLSTSALSVDRVCSLLICFKAAFQKLKEQHNGAVPGDNRVSDRIAIFNCFIWDLSCFLWKGSTLPSLDPSSDSDARSNSICFTDLSRQTLESLHSNADHVRSALSITRGAVFAGYAADFLKKHKLEPSPNILRGKLKIKYLEYLQERGLNGVYTFLSTFVASLAKRKTTSTT